MTGRPTGRDPISNTAALVIVVALLAVSLTFVAVAIVARIRNPPAAARPRPGSGGLGAGRCRTAGLAVLADRRGRIAPVRCCFFICSRTGISATSGTRRSPEPLRTAPPPTRPPPRLPDATRHRPADVTTLRVLSAAAVVFVALVALATLMTARRPRPPAPPPGAGGGGGAGASPREAASQSLARAAELGLAQVGDPNREPRAAIIACYATMEDELARVPGVAPRDFDTASEVLARAVEHDALRSDSATPLVELFEEARFSPHVMGEGHRDSAVQALRQVLTELRDAS